MDIFISSVIRDFGEYRDAARRGIESIGHTALVAEDFPATATSPQQACLEGVRRSNVLILLLGERYGAKQESGLSATHEEYRAARADKPVLAFVLDGVEFEADQAAFAREVEDWAQGHLTVRFRNPEELGGAVTRALHEHAMAAAVGSFDEAEVVERADVFLPTGTTSSAEPRLAVVVASGPRQQVLRPSELEDGDLHEFLLQKALFGRAAVLRREIGTTTNIEGETVVFSQDWASVTVDRLGSVRVVNPVLPARTERRSSLLALIDEDLTETVVRSLGYTQMALDRVDPTARLQRSVLKVALVGGAYLPWRSRVEQQQSPDSATIGFQNLDFVVAELDPPSIPRAALIQDAETVAADLIAVLKRRRSR